MLKPVKLSLLSSILLTAGLSVPSESRGLMAAALSSLISAQSAAVAQSAPQDNNASNSTANFPDTGNNWAQPFISALAARNVVSGYPDGNYRPTRPVERDEFAAVIQSAFNQNPERQLLSGSYYRDVAEGYWAESAIEEAYEMGFMRGYPDRTFRPRQSVSRVEVLTALARNLELEQRVPTTPQSTAPATTQSSAQAQTPARNTRSQQTRRRSLMLPLAAASLLQPFVRPVAAVASPASTVQNNAARPATPTTQQSTPQQNQPSSREIVRQFYTDADQIPQYAIDAVAATTKAGIVVNHPNLRVLNPNQPATRADVAAFIHQALVNKGQLPPLANNAASRYIVGRDQINRVVAK